MPRPHAFLRPFPHPLIDCLLALAVVAGLACGSGSMTTQASIVAPEVQDAVAEAPAADANDATVELGPALPPLPLAWQAPPHSRTDSLPAAPAVAGLAAVVVDEASGAVLYDKDAHVALPPASLTKIATLILALESGRMDEWVDVDVDSREMRGSTVMGLLPGDRFTLRDLCYGLILPSGNDAALAIGRFVAGSDAAFVTQMNDLLARLNLHDSHFANPHGLGGRDHVTSAYDLAMLSRFGMSIPGFKEIVTAPSWVARGGRNVSLGNINGFLYAFAGADGIKTGYTRGAGHTLAASATRNGHRLYAVVLNSDQRETDASRLLTWAFTNFSWNAQ